MGDQLAALIWVRFLIFKHSFFKSKSSLVSMLVFVPVATVILTGSIMLIPFLFMVGTRMSEPLLALLVCDALVLLFAMFWATSLMVEIQRSDIIDLRKMLQLPISLKMVFFLNYAASLVSIGSLPFFAAIVAFSAGLSGAHGPQMLLIIPAAVLFYLMMGAWTYYLRGLLVILLENKRRRRTVIMLVSLCFMLLFQIPNLARYALHTRAPRDPNHIEQEQPPPPAAAESTGWDEQRILRAAVIANAAVPLGWLPLAAYTLAAGQGALALLSIAGLGLFTAVALELGYRSTRRYYLGVGRVRARKPPPARSKPKDGRSRIIEFDIPFLDDDTAGVASAAFLIYAREPAIRYMWIMSGILGLVFLAFPALARSNAPGESFNWMPFVVIGWPFLSSVGMLFNQFGVDRDGFRSFILCPAARYKYLLGKNLALFPFYGLLAVVFLTISAILVRPPVSVQLTSFVLVVQLHLMACIVGNVLSLYVPFRLSADAMRGPDFSKRPILILYGFLAMFLLAVILFPAGVCIAIDLYVFPEARYAGISIGFLIALGILGGTVLLYRFSLRVAGNLFVQREQRILELLTLSRD